MTKKKKTTKKLDPVKTPEKTESADNDKLDFSNCDTCLFQVKSDLNKQRWCKRHQESLTTLTRKHIITDDAQVCGKFIPKMR